MHSLNFEHGNKTIQDFVHLFQNGCLNLKPGFQRASVWSVADRKKLIESLLQNFPVPSVFLYRQQDSGKLSYDVIDGKQRLETVLMFQGIGSFRGQRFSTRLKLGSGASEDWDWSILRKRGHEQP